MSQFSMPDIGGMSKLDAALKYAEAGLYIVPVRKGLKNPGSVVGKNWPAISTTNEQAIRTWWEQNPEYGIALHCGKSGLIVIDVDTVDEVPDDWHEMLSSAPTNDTREDDPGKGHYFYRMPPGRNLGNGKRGLAKGFGDIRGANGVVILPPSTHPGEMPKAIDKDLGGKYRQRRAGIFPILPDFISETMSDAKPTEYALTEIGLKQFFKDCVGNNKPKLLLNVVKRFVKDVEDGASRHDTSRDSLCWAFREARIGLYPAQEAEQKIKKAFYDMLENSDLGARQLGEGEWRDLVRWCASIALDEDIDKIKAEVEGREKKATSPDDGMYRPGYAQTDQEHAHAVIKWISDQARYAKDGAVWVMKEDNCWIADNGVTSSGIVALAADYMPEGVDPDEEDEQSGDMTQDNFDYLARVRYQNSKTVAGIANKLHAIVTTRRRSDEYSITMSQMDANVDALWTPSEPLDFLAQERVEGEGISRQEVHLHCTRYDPKDVPTPAWDALCAAVWPDPELRAWALQLFAVGATGYSPKMFIYIYGPADRGKTSIPTLIADVLGTYGRSDLQAGLVSSEAQPWDRAALHGLRFGFVDETPSNAAKPTEELKRLTGGSEVSAAFKGKQPFKFHPTHTLAFSSNHPPSLTDPAVVARMRPVPCVGRVAAVRAARAKLGELAGRTWQREAPGVLWQLVKLAETYVRNGDVIEMQAAPVLVKRAMQELRTEQDLLAEWMNEYCQVLPLGFKPSEGSTAQELFDFFAEWCRGRLRAKNYLNGKDVTWMGVQLRQMSKKMELHVKRSGSKKPWNIRPDVAKIKAGGVR